MAKTRQVLKIEENGKKYSVIYREGEKHNPYVVYWHSFGQRQNGYGLAEHKKIDAKFADMRSCLYYLSKCF